MGDRREVVACARGEQAVLQPIGEAERLGQPLFRLREPSPLEPDHAQQVESAHPPVEIASLREATHRLDRERLGQIQLTQPGGRGRGQQPARRRPGPGSAAAA